MKNNPTIIEKNSVEEIRVSLTEFNDKPLIDIRTYWKKSNETIPTKKGISLGTDKLDELIGALTDIKSQMAGSAN